MKISHLTPSLWDELAQLIHAALDTWYRVNLNVDRFGMDWKPFRVFTEIYESLDPGCCLVAQDDDGRLLGSIFYHPRETHTGIGVVTTHPRAARQGVARALLEEIIRMAPEQPLRLVSSALNLESFSLYTKLGFVPQAMFQDVTLVVPAAGFPGPAAHLRPATAADAARMADMEFALSGIRRQHDYDYFINTGGPWRSLVYEDASGEMRGFLNACTHPASRMLGPGLSADEAVLAALIQAMLDQHFRSQSVLWLVPMQATQLVRQAYAWGARNVEIHIASVRGNCPPLRGVSLPTFMPESG